MSQYYQCPNCARKGLYIFDVFIIIHRSLTDPALDQIECQTCHKIFKRYDGLHEHEKR